MSEIKRPDSFDGCRPDDEIFVESLPNQQRRVFRRHDNLISDISGVTDAVEPIDGGFRIGGRKSRAHHYIAERWTAEVDADRESTDSMMRGRVR